MQNTQPSFQQYSMTPTPGSGGTALRYGLIFGGLIGLIDIIYTYYLEATSPAWLSNLLQSFPSLPTILSDAINGSITSAPLYIILLVFYLLAGIFASRQSGRISTGVIAGLFVGIIYLIIDLFIANLLMSYLIIFPQLAQSVKGADLVSEQSSLLITGTIYSFVAGLVCIGLGALVGALGGAIGSR